jgi:hypothetical protein
VSKFKVKNGMGGSNGGKGRRDPTGILKERSKTRRRREGKQACREQQ